MPSIFLAFSLFCFKSANVVLDALQAIAKGMISSGLVASAERIAHECELLAKNLSNAAYRAGVFSDIGGIFEAIHDTTEAIRLWVAAGEAAQAGQSEGDAQDVVDSAKILAGISRKLALTNELPVARAFADTISFEKLRSATIEEIQ
jgi:hypothetical protein